MNPTHPKEIEIMHRESCVARVSAPPSRAGPSRYVLLLALILALLVAGIAGAQTVKLRADSLTPVVPRADSDKAPADSAATSTTKAAAALPKWFDELAVNAFVSTGYVYNSNRPVTGTNSYRVFDFNDNSFNLDVAELVVQIGRASCRERVFITV